MVNISKLKGKIVENNLTVSKLAEKMEVDRSTLYRKLNEKNDTITIKDVNKIVEVLNLNCQEAIDIFFTQFVA